RTALTSAPGAAPADAGLRGARLRGHVARCRVDARGIGSGGRAWAGTRGGGTRPARSLGRPRPAAHRRSPRAPARRPAGRPAAGRRRRARATPPAPATPVAYLLKRFPRLSETFILHEILELERQGQELRLFSIMNPGEELVHADVSRVRSPVTYFPTGYRAA